MDFHLISRERSSTIQNMVTNLLKDGHQFCKVWLVATPQGWSPTIQRAGQTTFQGRSPAKNKIVDHNPVDGFHFSQALVS